MKLFYTTFVSNECHFSDVLKDLWKYSITEFFQCIHLIMWIFYVICLRWLHHWITDLERQDMASSLQNYSLFLSLSFNFPIIVFFLLKRKNCDDFFCIFFIIIISVKPISSLTVLVEYFSTKSIHVHKFRMVICDLEKYC